MRRLISSYSFSSCAIDIETDEYLNLAKLRRKLGLMPDGMEVHPYKGLPEEAGQDRERPPRDVTPVIVTPGGYLITDEAGQILEVDHAAAVLLHASQRRLIHRMLASFVVIDDHARFYALLKQLSATNQVMQWESSLVLPDSTNLPVRFTVSYSLNDKNQPAILHWLVQDISTSPTQQPQIITSRPETESDLQNRLQDQINTNLRLVQELEKRKEIENEQAQTSAYLESRLRERSLQIEDLKAQLQSEISEHERTQRSVLQLNRELSELHTATQTLLSTLELEPLLGRILDAANNAIPSGDKGRLYLIAKDTGQLEMRAMIGYTDTRIRKINLRAPEGYVAKAVNERRPILANDLVDTQPLTLDGTKQESHSVHSAIVAPLILSDETLGALSLESSKADAFNEKDLQLLESFATTATAAIRNALLHAEAQRLALTDSLTNIYNRRGFFELGRRELERARRFNRQLTAMMIDMDHFKQINDTYGHAEGDRVIRLVAELLGRSIREVDILGRYGGDEFNILLPETDLFAAANVAERLRINIYSLSVDSHGQSTRLSASLGIAKFSPDIPDLSVLLDRADAAMYTAKQAGRNRVEIG